MIFSFFFIKNKISPSPNNKIAYIFPLIIIIIIIIIIVITIIVVVIIVIIIIIIIIIEEEEGCFDFFIFLYKNKQGIKLKKKNTYDIFFFSHKNKQGIKFLIMLKHYNLIWDNT